MQTDRAFAPCSTDIKVPAKNDIAAAFGIPEISQSGTEVKIVGHADEQPLGPDCTSRIGVGGEEGNGSGSIAERSGRDPAIAAT
jgi:hypothetical protein